MDIPRKFQWFHSVKNDISGAFLNSQRILEKGTAFLFSFQKIINLFYRQAGVSGSFMLSDAPAFLFSESFYFTDWLEWINHVQQAKRALVRKCLDPDGGMVQRPADLPVHHSKAKRRSAQNLKLVKTALSRPAVSFAGVRTEIVWEPESIN